MKSTTPDLYATFRPRMTRNFARATMVALVLGFIILMVTSPGSDTIGYPFLDSLLMLVVLALCLLLAWRHGSVFAIPTREGIRIRNLVYSTVLTWPEIESVRFGGGRPWVSLDLTNGHTLAVMAIQSADGAFGLKEAGRLSALVVGHGEATEPQYPVDDPPL